MIFDLVGNWFCLALFAIHGFAVNDSLIPIRAPFAPIFAYETIVGVKDRVHGYEVNPYTPINSWNTNEWSVS